MAANPEPSRTSAGAKLAGKAPYTQGIRDRSMVLLLIGTFLLLPPLARIVPVDANVLGLPALVIYVFSIWAALIVFAAVFANRLWQEGVRTDRSTTRSDPV